MNIIVEGPDNSGKSTLVECISKALGWRVIVSPGPSRNAQEFNERARQSLGQDRIVFDRHCIVSEYIYGTARGSIMTDPLLERMFYDASHLLIFCFMPEPTMEGHVVKDHDSAEHLALITSKQILIHRHYNAWALHHAHIFYRKGETPMRIVRFISGELRQ
jgi:hypothetical protein